MKRINTMRFYRLGNLTRLRDLREGERAEGDASTFAIMIIQLKAFIEAETENGSLSGSVKRAQELLKQLQEEYFSAEPLTQSKINLIEFGLSRFETSLDDDLTRLPTYEVEPVAAYSFGQLIDAAETVFPETLRKSDIMPAQTIFDFRSAGACLAFDLSTACGFHVFRATDAMLRKYCDYFGAEPKGSGRDWGRFIQALRDVFNNAAAPKKPNLRTIELLDAIRANDRNPVIHPEQNLDSEEALSVFDLCKNAVSLMALDIRNSP